MRPFCSGVLKGEANDALHALARVDVLLRRDLVRRAHLEVAAHVHVHAFGVLADDGEVNVVGRRVLQRTERSVEQADRAHVGVKVHLEAHAQQDFLGMDVAGDAWIAEGTDEDGVEIARQHVEAVGGDGGAVDEIAVGAPVEDSELDSRAAGADYFQGVRNNFLADAISGNNCDAFVGAHDHRR